MFVIAEDENMESSSRVTSVQNDKLTKCLIRENGQYRIQNQRILLIYESYLDKSSLKKFHLSLVSPNESKISLWKAIHENNQTLVLIDFGYIFNTQNNSMFDYSYETKIIRPSILPIKKKEWNGYIHYFNNRQETTSISPSEVINLDTWFDQVERDIEEIPGYKGRKIKWVYDLQNRMMRDGFLCNIMRKCPDKVLFIDESLNKDILDMMIKEVREDWRGNTLFIKTAPTVNDMIYLLSSNLLFNPTVIRKGPSKEKIIVVIDHLWIFSTYHPGKEIITKYNIKLYKLCNEDFLEEIKDVGMELVPPPQTTADGKLIVRDFEQFGNMIPTRNSHTIFGK